jgi:hypothetical protein
LRRSSSPCHVFYVVFASEHQLTSHLTLELEWGKEALAIFSHKEEAEMFLRSCETAGECWHIRETSAGEVVSLLYGPCCGAKSVALDPLPQMLADRLLGLVALERSRFVEWVTVRQQGPTVLEHISRPLAKAVHEPLWSPCRSSLAIRRLQGVPAGQLASCGF